MKKILLLTFILVLSVSLFGCTGTRTETLNQEELQQSNETDEQVVLRLVEEFGKKLQNVSILAPQEIVSKGIQENYSTFVSPSLIEKWQSSPEAAPGRMLSSPWPDRIDNMINEKLSETEYEVQGEIIEVTSTELDNGGIAAKRPITLFVREINNEWLIDDVILGKYE